MAKIGSPSFPTPLRHLQEIQTDLDSHTETLNSYPRSPFPVPPFPPDVYPLPFRQQDWRSPDPRATL
ncbi:MAG: hypothetical protein D6728_18070 [Cyanobacteria bacterium J055]|nr:MAG: hypothetical protein D6728_18070 [Cyanobacteria bacterium J055]